MKGGSFCDIINVNKEKKGEITLPWGTPQHILSVFGYPYPVTNSLSCGISNR